MEKEVDTNYLIFISVFFIILIFLIMQPVGNTGLITLPLVGDLNEISNVNLIGAIVFLVVIWIVVIVLYIKLKKKKQLEKLPKLPEIAQTMNNITNEPSNKNSLSEEELKQLFKEIAPTIEPLQSIKQEVKTEINPELKLSLPPLPKPNNIQEKKIVNKSDVIENKTKDIEELKKLILNLFNKNYTKQSIVKYLKKKGWSLIQMAQAIKEINEKNLNNYIKEAVSLGYKKEQLYRPLLSKRWNNEDINKAMKSV